MVNCSLSAAVDRARNFPCLIWCFGDKHRGVDFAGDAVFRLSVSQSSVSALNSSSAAYVDVTGGATS